MHKAINEPINPKTSEEPPGTLSNTSSEDSIVSMYKERTREAMADPNGRGGTDNDPPEFGLNNNSRGYESDFGGRRDGGGRTNGKSNHVVGGRGGYESDVYGTTRGGGRNNYNNNDILRNNGATATALDRHLSRNNPTSTVNGTSSDQPSGNYSVAGSQDSSFNGSRHPNFTSVSGSGVIGGGALYGDRRRRGGGTNTAITTTSARDMHNHPKANLPRKAKDSDVDSFHTPSHADHRNRVKFADHIFGPNTSASSLPPARAFVNSSDGGVAQQHQQQQQVATSWRDRSVVSSNYSVGSGIMSASGNTVNTVNTSLGSGVGSSLGGHITGGNGSVMSAESDAASARVSLASQVASSSVYSPYLSGRRALRAGHLTGYLTKNKIVAVSAVILFCALNFYTGGALRGGAGSGDHGMDARQRELVDRNEVRAGIMDNGVQPNRNPFANNGATSQNNNNNNNNNEGELDWDKIPPHLRGYYAKMHGVGEQFKGVAQSAEEQIQDLQRKFDEQNEAEEVQRQKQAQEEAEKQQAAAAAAEEAQRQKQAQEEAQKQQQAAAEEAQRQKQAQEEAQKQQQAAAEEAQRQKQAQEEAQKQQQAAAEEAQRQKQAQEEAQQQQQAAAEEAQRQKQAQEEAQKQQAAAAEEAQRQQQAAAAAEVQRQQQAAVEAAANQQQQAPPAMEAPNQAEAEAARQRAAAEAQRINAAEEERRKAAEEQNMRKAATAEEDRRAARERAAQAAAAQQQQPNPQGDGAGGGESESASAIDDLQGELAELMVLLQKKKGR